MEETSIASLETADSESTSSIGGVSPFVTPSLTLDPASFVNEALARLDDCSSHADFMAATIWLRQLCLTDNALTVALFLRCNQGVMGRILSTRPNNEQDDLLLSNLLSTLSSLLRSLPSQSPAPASSVRFLTARLKSLLLPLLAPPDAPAMAFDDDHSDDMKHRWGSKALNGALTFSIDEDPRYMLSLLPLRVAHTQLKL